MLGSILALGTGKSSIRCNFQGETFACGIIGVSLVAFVNMGGLAGDSKI